MMDELAGENAALRASLEALRAETVEAGTVRRNVQFFEAKRVSAPSAGAGAVDTVVAADAAGAFDADEQGLRDKEA